MASNNYPQFDEQKVQEAIATARRHSESLQEAGGGRELSLDDGRLKVSAQCISVTVQNGQVCLNLPLGLGQVCLPIPPWVPSGTAAQACIDICTKWGIPCGVEVTVSVAGQQVVQKGFGCSC